MMNANATEDDVFLALAKYVLAVSSAVGGRAVANVRKCSDQSKCQDVKNIKISNYPLAFCDNSVIDFQCLKAVLFAGA